MAAFWLQFLQLASLLRQAIHHLRALVKKGAFGIGVMETDDVHADYEALKAKGVKFLCAPTERLYGSEAVLWMIRATGSA